MASISIKPHDLNVVYTLCLPNGSSWLFHDLLPESRPYSKTYGPIYCADNNMVVPVDLITAATLRLIKPGDDSGIDDHTWAWLKMLSLTGGQT